MDKPTIDMQEPERKHFKRLSLEHTPKGELAATRGPESELPEAAGISKEIARLVKRWLG